LVRVLTTIATKLKKRIPSDKNKEYPYNFKSIQGFKVIKPQDEVRHNNGDNILLPFPSLDTNYLKSSIVGLPIQPTNEVIEITHKQRNRLFEEFFIIGAMPSVLNSIPIKDSVNIQPTVLYQYPNLPQNINWYHSEITNSDKRRSVKTFAFPEGLRVRPIDLTESMSEAQM